MSAVDRRMKGLEEPTREGSAKLPMRLLVTGGAGYIGSIVASQLLAGGHEVVVLDNLERGHREAVPAGATPDRGDLLDARRSNGPSTRASTACCTSPRWRSSASRQPPRALLPHERRRAR